MVHETIDETQDREGPSGDDARPVLVVAWCADVRRVGEVIPVAARAHVLGRGAEGDDARPRSALLRQRPGLNEPRPPLELPALSRTQLVVQAAGDVVRVENVGRRPLIGDDGVEIERAELAVGDCVEVKGQLLLSCAHRPATLPRARSAGVPMSFAFGGPDPHGFVGESPLAWCLRDEMTFVAGRAGHVLVLGESGVGKEAAAQAIHAMSKRAGKPLVSRSAATIPGGIADAELFGNLANYPNPGMPERKGMIGEADGSTLFLDEIGELPEELQARLLRVLDERGEYHRLGEAKARRANLRLVAATNRPISALKHDVAARFRLRVTIPGLGERREDIPLLALHLLRRVAGEDEEVAARFMDGDVPRVAFALVRALMAHAYQTHARELDALLWRSICTSPGGELLLTPEVQAELAVPPRPARAVEIGADELRAALERAGGVQERAWRELGLANRHVLARLLKKHGLG